MADRLGNCRELLRRLIHRFLDLLAPGLAWTHDERYLMLDGLIGNIAGTFVNPFMTAFALGFGATKFHISLLSAVPGLFGNLMQLPASHLVERTGRRKSLIISTGVLTRLGWMLVLASPFIFRGIAGVYFIIAVLSAVSIVGAVTTPAWTSLVSDLIPRDVRGRFFASRNIVMSIGALLTVNLAGQIVERGGFPLGYVASMSIFLVLSWISLWVFSKVSDVPFSPSRPSYPGQRGRWLDMEALRSPVFLAWVTISTFFNFAVGIVGALFGAYLLQDLGGSPVHLAYMTFGSTLMAIIGQRFWGPVSDRRGPKFAVYISAFLTSFVPLFWFFARTPWQAVMAETYSGLAWSGWTLCTFNLMLEITPADRRPSYVATANFIGGITAFVAPLVGGYLAQFYTLRPLMLVSAAGRFTTGVLIWAFVRDSTEAECARRQ
ncbi:MAG: MFS transporter [Firmicutes bacterium]|nr:MFS transporter [Candidatus Fermentithermobacillaceae bacterium]